MGYIPVDESKLEQTTETFFGRMSDAEAERVKQFVEHIEGFMSKEINDPFLIAGVGGTLRYLDPMNAKDIDLAVVGFNYTPSPARERGHSVDHVTFFTDTITNYFKSLVKYLKGQGYEGEAYRLRAGSGPWGLSRFAYSGKKDESKFEVVADIDSFGQWNSKSLQVELPGGRPIDILFVFNEAPKDWLVEQGELKDLWPSKQATKSEQFPYAVLAERGLTDTQK